MTTSSVDPASFGAKTSAIDVCNTYAEHIKDKVILLTGPTITGVGYGTAEAIARLGPKLLILAGRNLEK